MLGPDMPPQERLDSGENREMSALLDRLVLEAPCPDLRVPEEVLALPELPELRAPCLALGGLGVLLARWALLALPVPGALQELMRGLEPWARRVLGGLPEQPEQRGQRELRVPWAPKEQFLGISL